MEEMKEYIIKNQRLLDSLDITKSVIQDICNYLNNFDPGAKTSSDEKLKRYEELVEILKETVSGFNDKYALNYGVDNIPLQSVKEWNLPDDFKEKVLYIRDNLGYFIKKYELFKKENLQRKENQPYNMIGFTKKELKRFITDYREIENVFRTILSKYENTYKSLIVDKRSLQEYADLFFEGKKHKAQYTCDQMLTELEQYYINKNNAILNEVSKEKSKEKTSRISKLYEEADQRAWQRMIESSGDMDSYYDFYKEEMAKIDDLLEEEDANKPFALQKEIALSNKKSGHKAWKFVDFDKGGKETLLTSEIKDIDGDEEFIDNNIFKKKSK